MQAVENPSLGLLCPFLPHLYVSTYVRTYVCMYVCMYGMGRIDYSGTSEVLPPAGHRAFEGGGGGGLRITDINHMRAQPTSSKV
jgi:hypothetical protein